MVRACPPEDRGTLRVAEIMHPIDDSVRIPPSASVSEALRRMVEGDVGRLLVMENGHCLGLITHAGIVRYLRTKTQLEAGGRL
jgi:CBS domain-containing protein